MVSVRKDTDEMNGTMVSSAMVDRKINVGEVWLTVDYQGIVGV